MFPAAPGKQTFTPTPSWPYVYPHRSQIQSTTTISCLQITPVTFMFCIFSPHIVVGTKKKMAKMPPQECACCSGDYSRPCRTSDYTALHHGTASEQSNHGTTLGTMRYLSGEQEENHVKPPIMTVNHRDTDLNLEPHE